MLETSSPLLEIVELIKEQHPDSEITCDDLLEIQRFLWQKQHTKDSTDLYHPYPDYLGGDELTVDQLNTVEFDYRADVGRAFGFIVGAVLGVLFLPALGIASGWFTGALLGGAIGYRLVGFFSGGNQPATDRSDTTLYRLSGVGGILTVGQPIPKIYGNSTNNPDGGVYLNDPAQCYTRITSAAGARYLDQIFVLATGRLGEVNQALLKLDDKPLTDWLTGDITTAVSTGRHDQQPISTGITGFSQALALQSNNFIGLAPAVTIAPRDNVNDQVDGLIWDGVDNVGGGGFNKNTSRPVGYASYYITNPRILGSLYGDYINLHGEFRDERPTPIQNLRYFLGYYPNATNITPPTGAIVGVEITGNVWEYYENGVNVATGFILVTPTVFVDIRVYESQPAGYVQVFINNTEVLRRTTGTSIGTVHGHYYLHTPGARVDNPEIGTHTQTALDIMPGIGRRFRLHPDSIDKLKSGTSYRASNNSRAVTLVGKNSTGSWVEFNEDMWISDRSDNAETLVPDPLVIIANNNNLLIGYRSKTTTTKRVTGVELIVQANIWARNNDGNLVTHGAAFVVHIATQTGTPVIVERFLIISTSEKPTIRSIEITNLPLDIYTITIDGLSQDEIQLPIRTFDDSARVTYKPGGSFGSQIFDVTVEANVITDVARARSVIDFRDKRTTSSDQSPAMQLTHINELVQPTTTYTYPGFTLAHSRSLASDRIQTAATQSWFIPRGAIVRQYLAYSTTVTSTNLDNIRCASPIVNNGVTVGDTIRVLKSGQRIITEIIDANTVRCREISTSMNCVLGSALLVLNPAQWSDVRVGMSITATPIPVDCYILAKYPGNQILIGGSWEERREATATGSFLVTFNQVMPQTTGEEVVVWNMGSSNYFPDLYVDRLLNPIDGLGEYVDQDHFIDYESIVHTRKVCVLHKRFYDGVFSTGSFEDWCTQTAPSSLLFCTEIFGRFGLVAQEKSPQRPYLFNASNCSKYTEPGVPWQQELVNTIDITYQDNQGRAKQLRVQTTDAANGIDRVFAQTINTQGVTSKAQAIEVACVSLKSLILQLRGMQLETDIARGIYVMQGDIARTQHPVVEYDKESSGFVRSALALTNSRLVNFKTTPLRLITSGYVVLESPHHLKNTDTIIIAGSTAGNGTYTPGQWVLVDSGSIMLVGVGVSGTGGTLTGSRTRYDQIISVSEPSTIDSNSRISIAHDDITSEDELVVTDNGDGLLTVIGVEKIIKTGDCYAIGQASNEDRVWRITSLKPDIQTNTVSITGVLWDDRILDRDGLYIVP